MQMGEGTLIIGSPLVGKFSGFRLIRWAAMVLESAPAASNQSASGVRLMFRGKAPYGLNLYHIQFSVLGVSLINRNSIMSTVGGVNELSIWMNQNFKQRN